MLARSYRWKVAVSTIAAVGFVWLYEATMLDSQNLPWLRPVVAESRPQPPGLGVRLSFGATAYCKGLTTAAGVAAQSGVAAADPSILPLGSIIQIDAPNTKYDGIYSILDTGPAVQGREIDIYMWSCYDALRFGRRPVHLTVLRLGWDPRATTPSLADRLFKRPEAGPDPLPSRPVPIGTSGDRSKVRS
jgi:3D (Asp-Asp-Asp) domain-containing protein